MNPISSWQRGRLLDHINQGNLSLKFIEILILDEVDRMLDMGFIEDVTKIIQKTLDLDKLFYFRQLSRIRSETFVMGTQ